MQLTRESAHCDSDRVHARVIKVVTGSARTNRGRGVPLARPASLCAESRREGKRLSVTRSANLMDGHRGILEMLEDSIDETAGTCHSLKPTVASHQSREASSNGSLHTSPTLNSTFVGGLANSLHESHQTPQQRPFAPPPLVRLGNHYVTRIDTSDAPLRHHAREG